MTKQEFLAMNLSYGVKGLDGNGDIAGLIEKGEAIDVNKLNNNLYK